MASAKLDFMGFEEALKCMDPLEVRGYLQKTLNYLNKNDNACYFPNISPHVEAFLVRLAADTRNLKSNRLFNGESKELALQIIEAIELNRDVFRWACTYEKIGTLHKNILVYKKIFTNAVKMKPGNSKKLSSLSQRLIISQTEDPVPQFDIPTGSKIQLLNTTLRFLKTDGAGVLLYPDMPVTHAQYMCTLVNSPKSDSSVGFGFKSLYAPLFEAMNVLGLDYEFEISFAEKGDIASLKLAKIRKRTISVGKQKKIRQENIADEISIKENSCGNSPRSETTLETNSKASNNSLNTSLSSSASSSRSKSRRRRNRPKLPDGVSAGFIADTLQSLIEFTADVSRASVTFKGLTNAEATFVRGVKKMAGSKSKHGSLEAPLRAYLRQLNANIEKVIETCWIKIEDETHGKARFITLKKLPKVAPKKTPSAIQLPTKSRAFAAAGSKNSSSKDNLIQFKSAGKLSPGEVDTTDNTASATDSATGGARSKDYLNKRKAKLLEDMSVPVESDKGKRMMELMGWAGGALGARAGGILEPILPAIELPAGAGLGHVPPPKPERRPSDFRLALLQELRGFLLQPAAEKVIKYTVPLTKKEKNFVSSALTSLNKRKALSLGIKAEQELAALLVKDMALLARGVELRADVSHDRRKITLTKVENNQNKPKLYKLKDTDHATMTVLNTIDCEFVNEDAINKVMASLTSTTCKTPMAVRGRAMRMLFLKRFIDLVDGNKVEREFRVASAMQKKTIAFLENVVSCLNRRVKCPHVPDEEMRLYEDLMETASKKNCYLSIAVDSTSKFVLRKMSNKKAPQNVASSSTQDNNNNNQQSVPTIDIMNQNEANNATGNNDNISGKDNPISNANEPFVDKLNNQNEANKATGNNDINSGKDISNANEPFVDKVNNHVAKEIEHIDKDNCTEDTKMETQCDDQVNRLVNSDSLQVEEVEMEIDIDAKDVNGLLQNSSVNVKKCAKIDVDKCDIKVKDNVIKSVTLDKDIPKQDMETDEDTDNSWSTCSDHGVDLSKFDKEIEELDKVLCEVGLGFNVRDSDASVSPKSDSQDYNNIKAKKSIVKSKNKVVVIAPKNPNVEKHAGIFQKLQTFMWNQIDREENAIPLLKCYGIQNGGLVYYCHDAKDVTWLKRTINAAKLDLKMYNFAEDFIEERKSRKLAVKINSFMPLDAEKLLSNIEMYNDIDTQFWKVLSYESFNCYVIFIVDVDETSFEYISERNFSLYMGIDKAQFSIIF